MKKIFNVILFALFCTSLAQAQGNKPFEFTYEGQTLKYEVANGNEAMVSKQQSERISGDVKIPENVTFAGKKYTVTSIGEDAFNSTGLTSVTIPNSVTTIGGFAFAGCASLTSVFIPNSVTTIGGFAFAGCANLTSITIPNSVTTIGAAAFFGCTGLTSVTIPNSVTTIDGWAFSECKGLTSVTIPNSVTEIGMCAFEDCENLKSINVAKDNSHYCSENGVLFDIIKKRLIQCPCGIKGNYAIPDGVTTIGEYAFKYCTGLTSVIIPNRVTTIGDEAFARCENLKSINVAKDNSHYCSENGVLFDIIKKRLIQCPCGIKGNYAIPDGVTTIGEYAFKYCTGLTSVIIPNRVTTIGDEAFARCENLKSINVAKGNSHYCSENGVLFDISKKTLIQYPCGIKGKYVIPNSVTTIGEGAFMYCGITDVTIPNNVKTIGAGAFGVCKGLTNVTIPSSVTMIEYRAFGFCEGLTVLAVENATPPEMKEDVFDYVSGNITIYVPAESVEKYKAAEGWSEYVDKIKAKGK